VIGVSYTGHDGRKASFSVQGAGDAASRMAEFADRSRRETVSDAQGLLRMARKPGAQVPAQPAPQRRKERVMAGGSVVRSPEGALCLRGEELNPLVPGTRVYGAKDGSKGFFSLDEIDPPTRGSVVGRSVGDDSQSFDASDAKKDRPDGTAWSIRVQTDERADKDNVDGLITVYKYFRLLYYSAAGRVVGCSEEWREVAFSFIAGAGAGGGKWEVRPVKNGNDQITEFLFGAASELGSESDDVNRIREKDAVTSVKVLTCPGGA